jgi:hypothetical protein
MLRSTIAVFFLTVLVSATCHAFECVPGSYKGKMWSVSQPLHGHAAELAVTKNADGWCVMRFKSPAAGADEIWELKDNKLSQVEIDKDGKETARYGATLEVRNGEEGYYINCKDGTCDTGVDSRYFWRIVSSGNKIVYSVWGVAPDKQSDPKAKARKRHEYTFTKVK